MLTSLEFLNPGNVWPPKDEDTQRRLRMYEANRELFEGNQAKVYNRMFHKIERVIPHFRDVIDYPVVLNYQKLISMKVADLLFGDRPLVSVDEEKVSKGKALGELLKNGSSDHDFFTTAYMSAIDVSRYGDGLLYVYKKDRMPYVDVTQPSIWFPVVSPDNVREVTHHVLAWVVCENGEQPSGKRRYRLKVQVHKKGSYEERLYELKPNSIGGYRINAEMEEAKVRRTGLSDFAIIQVANTRTSDRQTGIDDYRDVNTIIYELMVRCSQVSKILDKHASPSVQGPSSALEKDHVTGEWKLAMGNYFKRDDESDPRLEYLTWDGQLASAFKEIEVLTNQLYMISEMSPALLGDSQSGTATSGTAMRLRMISTLAKVNRIKMNFTPAIKKALRLASELGGKGIVGIKEREISIKWQSGLPNDPKEEAEILRMRTGGAQTMSVERGLMQYDGMEPVSARDEVARILDEQMQEEPMERPPMIETKATDVMLPDPDQEVETAKEDEKPDETAQGE